MQEPTANLVQPPGTETPEAKSFKNLKVSASTRATDGRQRPGCWALALGVRTTLQVLGFIGFLDFVSIPNPHSWAQPDFRRRTSEAKASLDAELSGLGTHVLSCESWGSTVCFI